MTKTVMAFGSFDLLHPGHVHYLNRASKLGDRLIVVVARDSSIKAMKGRPPVFGEKDRVELVGSLKSVHRAVVGNRIRKREDLYKILKRHNPSVIVFGYDQRVDIPRLKAWLLENKIKARIVRIHSSLDPKRYKSSRMRSRLAI